MPGAGARRQKREHALEQARTAGVEQAALEHGVTVATLRRWARQAGLDLPEAAVSPIGASSPEPAAAPAPAPEAEPPAEKTVEPAGSSEPQGADADLNDDLEALRRTARRAFATAERLLDRDPAAARNSAVVGGVAVDKLARLREAASAEQERHLHLSERQAEQLAAVIRAVLEAAGIPLATVRGALREALQSSTDAGAVTISPATAERARRQVREHFRAIHEAELREALEAELVERLEPPRGAPLALPAAGGTVEVEPEPMAPARTVVRVTPPADPEPEAKPQDERGPKAPPRTPSRWEFLRGGTG